MRLQESGHHFANVPNLRTMGLHRQVRPIEHTLSARLTYSIAKITRPRDGSLPPVMENMKQVYEYLSSGQSLIFRGGSWRLPVDLAAQLVAKPFLALCRQHAIEAKTCKANLISTP